MSNESEIFKGIRKDIFKEIQSHGKISFNRLKDKLGLRGNELSYHIRLLLESGMITRDDGYSLTEKGKLSYPLLPVNTGEEKPIFVVCAVALLKDDMILLQKKPREPEKDSLILFGGKILEGTSIDESVKIYVKEQAGCDISDIRLRCVNEFMRKGEGGVFHDVVFFYTATPISDMKESLIRAKLDELDDEKLFGDNRFLIRKMLWNKEPRFTRDIQVKNI
ncbi:MAG: helix-turn-helix domain-containing protein [Candidatus Woesearchaeota archaeon]